MIEKIKKLFLAKSDNPNTKARKEQLITALVIVAVITSSYAFYLYSVKHEKVNRPVSSDVKFDGVFDEHFELASDEALLIKQQNEIDALNERLQNNEKSRLKNEGENKPAQDDETRKLIKALNEKLSVLEKENQKTNEKLQVAMLQNQQKLLALSPPTREEQEEKLRARSRKQREYYKNAGMETLRFKRKINRKDERTPENYVWAGTFASGIMLTGVMGDAGVNGSKNTGTVLIRIDENGTMPNGKRSKLKDCFVLGSSYGDLSGDAVVIHLETLSCARPDMNFELKVYGSVYDQDAMQDLRGTPILKTKPLLEYTAAAGLLAGIGDGLSNYGSIQSINPDGSLSRISPTSIGRTAAGGALSNPANKISDYIMKIADIYHPMVVAKAGRRVSVMFIKGFWIDKAHQKYESGKAIDNQDAQNERSNHRTITRVQSMPGYQVESTEEIIHKKINSEIARQDNNSHTSGADTAFLSDKGIQSIFSESSEGAAS